MQLDIVPNSPNINIKQNDKTILNDPTNAQYNFGNIKVGVSSFPITFLVKNSGTSTLNVQSIISNNPNFTIVGPTNGLIEANESSSFTITLTPTTTGAHLALITIQSNDLDESSFFFLVQGRTQDIDVNLEIVAKTGATLGLGTPIALGQGPSINDAGKVAFIARDTDATHGRVMILNNSVIEEDCFIGTLVSCQASNVG